MEYKTTKLDLKASEDGVIEGYGSMFGNVDRGGDIVRKGAFADSLASESRPKMLFQHDPSNPVGVWEEMAEDETGLRVRGRLLTQIQSVKDLYERVKAGAIDGLSIGYRTVEASKEGAARVIEKAELWEVSLVTFPMNPSAKIDAVKAAQMSKQEIETLLTRDARLSSMTAKRLLSGGYEAVVSKRDAGADGLSELTDFMRSF